MSDPPRQIQLSSEVKEIIAICAIGLIVYLLMVCRILCRAPARLAEGLALDVDADSFTARKPENPDGYFHNESDPDTVRRAAKESAGRVIVDRGRAKFQLEDGEPVEIDPRRYGAFNSHARFRILDPSEDLLFHLDLYSSLTVEQTDAKTKHE